MGQDADREALLDDEGHKKAELKKLSLKKGWPLFKRFWPYLKTEKRAAFSIGMLMLIGVPPSIASPLLVRHLFDVVLPANDTRLLITLGVLMLGLTLLSGVLGYAQSLLSIGLHNRVSFRLTRDLFVHVLRLPLRYFDQAETGYLMSRVRDDVAALENLMLDRLVGAGVNLLRAVVFLFLLLFLDLGLALSGITLLLIITGMVVVVSPVLRRRSEKAREADAKSSAALHEALTGIFTVRTTAQERGERRRYVESVKRAIRTGARRDVLGTLTSTTFGLVGTLGTYVIVAVGAYRIAMGQSTFGSLFAFFLFLMQLMSSASSVFYLIPGIQRSLASLQRLTELLDEATERVVHRDFVETSTPTTETRLEGRFELDSVSLRYDSGPLALEGIDLLVEPGEVIAVVGRSGAGKSSLVHMLSRLYEPSGGQILLDGQPLDSYPLTSLRAQIGVVPQDVFLFNRSVRDNITYASPDATDEQLFTAAIAAHADEFIDRLPKRYDTIVGERGVRLSGGQKQRLAIARELLRDPPILILDEATSHLDAESEALVQEAIARLLRGRTCFVIAHRLSTTRNADRIVVLDAGKIVERGSHNELLEIGGVYRDLYELQLLKRRR